MASVVAPQLQVVNRSADGRTQSDPIDCHSADGCGFVLGSAVTHPHDLVSGSYSVHTSRSTLAVGETGIRRIGQELRAAGRLG